MDLHGLELQTGWEAYRKATQGCYDKKRSTLKVITGQGEMQREFLRWVENDPFAVEAVNIDNNKGAWKVTIKKHAKPKNKPRKNVDKDSGPDLEILFTKFKKIGQ
jgi:hypothetical protein